MKTLILYYSYGGNTRSIAKMLQKELGGDLAEIETVVPYTGSYNSVVDQGQQEVSSGLMPELKPLSVNVADYDRIILGTPVWWYTFAPAVKTLLAQVDLSNKEIWPFATNGGWIGHTFKDIQTACPGAKVKKGLNVKFNEHRLACAESEISAWAKGIEMK